MTQTHYERLKVSRSASLDDIRAAWRAYTYRSPHAGVVDVDDAAKHFAAGEEAFRVLSDPAQRAAYDRGLDGPDPLEKALGRAPTIRERRGAALLRFVALVWKSQR
jgi:curved DNA-binding protein CbpA